MTNYSHVSRIALAMGIAIGCAGPAFAQDTPSAADSAQGFNVEDIIVTARKREESLISVPVVVSAVGSAELERRAVANLDGIARIVPQLLISPQGGSVQGGNIAIRGISGPDSNPFGDQAVSFNIDGVQVAKANVRRMSDTDIAQVEVLKGPQALFFGKNSPAGIVSIRTADPTDRLQAGIAAGYEFEAREIRTEGYVSGPLTETLGARISGIYSEMDGWLKDETPTNSPYFQDGRNPKSQDFSLRGTLLWEPTAEFTARLKLNYSETSNNGPQSTGAYISCPFGVRQTGSNGPCGADGRVTNSGYGTFLATLPGTLNLFRADGNNFQKQEQMLHGLELNYDISDQIRITSVTGYYDVTLDQCQNYESDFSILLPSCNVLDNREFSQELRIATDYDGPLNFTAGLYFADTKSSTGSLTYLFGGAFDLLAPGLGGPTTPVIVNNYFLEQEGSAYSAFLQMSFKPVEVVEINVGGRYSYEKKRLTNVRSGSGLGEGNFAANPILDDSTIVIPAVDNDNWNDFSPEVTVSYRPTQDLTVFGSYKHGFLSGGFNSSSVNFGINPDLSYDPQTIKGFEAGVKSALFDRTLLLNVAAYTYKVQDLQVTSFTNATSTIRNAGSVSIKGIEADFNYRTPLEGLSIRGAAAYNRGRYTSFSAAPCYNGQTPAQGCTLVGGNPTQNLDGTELIRAPKWNFSGGFNFETAMGMGLKFGLSGDVNRTSSYLTDASSAPASRQPAYTLLDATVRVGSEDDSWQLALIGRNLGDKYYFVAAPDVPFTGSGAGTPGGVQGDRFASLSRGREIMLRASYKFGK